MKPRTLLFTGLPLTLLALALALASCEHTSVAPDYRISRELYPLEKRLVEAGNDFGVKLFREVVQRDPGNNVFISPLSVSMALGMTLNGASGSTFDAMQTTLELTGLTEDEINQSYRSLIDLLVQLDPHVKFQIANSIWYRQGMSFEPDFIKLDKTYFDALVQALNFDDPNAKDIINAWVNEKTNGRIDQIVDAINPEHVMFLINAVYFKGIWTYQFDPAQTQDDRFNAADGSQAPCQMMHVAGDFSYFANASFQAIELPYGDAGFSMVILLPRVPSQMDSLIGAITPETWAAWMGSFSTHAVQLSLPKFTLRYDLTMNDVLASLGMEIAFTGRADFTRMYRPGHLCISRVKHKTFVQVDEEGTEAAAVTSVEVSVTSGTGGGVIPIPMRVDHPFVFAIHENGSQTILFIGKVLLPTL